MVQQWVKNLTKNVLGKPKYDVGSIVIINGRKAKIIGGQYWGTHGLSNHWEWRYLDKKKPRTECGYGGEWKVVKK